MKSKRHVVLRVLLYLVLVASTGFTYAQNRTITGTVTDANDGVMLPGVSVVLKGTTLGTATDLDGKFQLVIPESQLNGAVLVASYIGYVTAEVPVSGDFVSIQLSVKDESLDEVVVIGYGKVKKEDATGSVLAVGSDDFNQGAITSPQELLVGKTAGVVITTNSGAPGSGATIRIRGGSSLNASNDPLIIIDGVPIDNNNVSGSSNFLAFVNPNDIETFTILKDASATAIYGNRASNGVIIITTKKGKAGKKMSVTYDGNTSVASAIKYMDVYTGDELREIAFSKYSESGLYTAENLALLGSENTDWQKEIFRTSVSHDHNVSVSGAVKNFPYRVSLGYTDQNGILKNTDMQRFTGSVNLDPTFFKDNLKVSVRLKGMNTNNNFGDAGAIGSAINMDPTQPIMDGNESTAGYYQWSTYGANLGTPNPVEQLMAADNKSTVQRLIASGQFDYTMPFLPELHANLTIATDNTSSEGHNNRPVTSPSVLTSPLWGRLSDYTGKSANNLLDFYLNYNNQFGIHKVDLTGGYSWQHFEREGDSYTRGIVDATHPYQKSDSSSFITENYLVSFFGRVNYSLMSRYLLTVTVRQDGSSRFAEENRWGLFPSVAFAYRIKDEAFLQDVSAISELKLRLGWGITGQQDIGNDYPAQARYMTSSMGSYYNIGGQFIPTLRPSAYDPDIKWEETTTQNIGLDFGFFNDRITGSVDLYQRVTEDLLNSVTIPSGSNFSNVLLTNVGSLENKGVEVGFNFIPVSTPDMSLNFGVNFTYNVNEITKLLISDDPNYIGVLYGDAFTGQKQVTRVGYPAYSFFVNQQVYDAAGNPIEGMYVDLSGQGGVVNGDNADKYIYHNPVADYLLGFNLRFNYKNFDMSASSRASIGNYVYNQVAAGASYDQMYQIGYWKNFPTYLSDTKFVKRQFTSDYFVENASFFKLDNVSVGYSFEKLFDKLSGRVSLTGQNLLTVTKYSGLDPEVSGGVDNNIYPRPRTVIVGLSLNL